ncbi:hypothetical protein [uncultured Marivita sp.]|uniref:hypothetical protein n=1 Tax=uncultured Marivita sp. TaxID=888080 RepID=UPI002620A891|nr:hypothetical protein [uncultured Marivita sp.]
MHRGLLLATGVFVLLIGAVLLVAPQAYFQLYATDYVSGMDFPARRFSPAVLALGAVLILARSLQPGPFLANLCLICALAFLGVAGTGFLAWSQGIARPSILGAAAIEVVIAAHFLWVWHRMRAR